MSPEQCDRPRVMMAWSSGKDSAWALHQLRQAGCYDIQVLLTTLNAAFDRVAMHAVRHACLLRQAQAVGLPLMPVMLPWPCSNDAYEAAMNEALQVARHQYGITHVAFGDLYLEDIRRYREDRLAGTGLEPLFPLWGRNTGELAEEMIAAGLKARITCLDPQHLPMAMAGRSFDRAFLAELPGTVDPCGEQGEFHTFVHDGPMFAQSVPIQVGPTVERDGFVFADLVCGDTTHDGD